MRMLLRALTVGAMLGLYAEDVLAGELLPPDRSVAEVVDHYIDETLRQESVKPAELADDAALLRRLMLDLVGRIPTAAESASYCGSRDLVKRERLVDRLMASQGFAVHQAAELDAMLMAGNRGSLRDYLVRAVGEGLAWDKIFRELMLPDQSDKNRKGAAEFLRPRVKD